MGGECTITKETCMATFVERYDRIGYGQSGVPRSMEMDCSKVDKYALQVVRAEAKVGPGPFYRGDLSHAPEIRESIGSSGRTDVLAPSSFIAELSCDSEILFSLREAEQSDNNFEIIGLDFMILTLLSLNPTNYIQFMTEISLSISVLSPSLQGTSIY